MSDQPQQKSSLEIDKEIANSDPLDPSRLPRLLTPMLFTPEEITNAFAEAQLIKDRSLGNVPMPIEKQPNPAVSSWQHKWENLNMNNNRELGPGDVKK